jgi:anaerobic magnesium-protoporphyrin IX monomethyl ester cyclase
MPFKRLLLVNPAHPSAEWRGLSPHIGQAYLAQTLLENGIEYDVLDMNLGYKFKHLGQKIHDFRPDLIGISLISFGHKGIYSLASKIKMVDPTTKIVVGGPHVTIMRDQVLKECTAIDYGVVSEGEVTLTELCQGQLPEIEIRGLISRNGVKIAYGGDREFISDLDQIPWPRYDKFELNKYIRETTIYSSRGCPHKCTFCPNRIISPHFRPRSPKNVVDEIEYWYDKGRRQFNFDDDNFNFIKERVFQICDEIERRGLKHLFLRCSNGIRADRVNREMLARMYETGFRYIAFGVDGGNNRMLEIIKKGETIETIEQAIKESCDLGYGVKLLFVVGTPYETREDVEDKVRISERYPIEEVHFYNLIPTPGTELYDWVKDNNFFLKDPEQYLNDASGFSNDPVFETPELPRNERIELFRYLNKVRQQIHRNAIRRTFGRNKVLGFLASYLVVNSFFERLFYQSRYMRNVIETLRYRTALRL